MGDPGRILVASTIAPHKTAEGTETAWLTHLEAMRESHPPGVDVFLAVEIDARGLAPYTTPHSRLLDRVHELDGAVWTFSIDKAPTSSQPWEIDGGDRYIRIATGRNLGAEYAITHGHTHVLWLDTDTEPTPDCIPRLLEVRRPLVFGHVPTYGLDGPPMPGLPGDTRLHWSSAGFCLVAREVFRRVRWGWDPDAGLTDDPTFARDVELVGHGLGEDWRAVTRHDVEGRHHPEIIYPLEQRPGDRRLYR